MDTMQSLKVFLTVVDEKSFSRAAERLDLSRAVVSKHVKNLEEEVGTRLLERTTRRIALTDSGRTFYERAQRAVSELDEAMLEAGLSTTTPRGKLRVTCSVSFGVLHLSGAISAFLDRYPDIRIELDLSDRFVDLAEEGFDIAVRVAAVLHDALIARKLTTARLIVCASPAYIAEHGTPRSPEDLVRHVCLAYTYSPQRNVWLFKRAGKEFTVPIEGRGSANSGDFLRKLAVDGRGLALLPTFIVGDDLATGRLVQVLDEYDAGELGIYAVYTQRKFLPAKVRALLDFLVEQFRGTPPWQQAVSGHTRASQQKLAREAHERGRRALKKSPTKRRRR